MRSWSPGRGWRASRELLARPAASTVIVWTPSAAAQIAVVGVLEAALPDDRALVYAAERLGAELLRADLPDGAEQLRGGRAERVAAQVDALDGDAGEVALALEQVVADRRRHVDLDAHVRVRQHRELLDHVVLHVLRRDAERAGQAREAAFSSGVVGGGIGTGSPRWPLGRRERWRHLLAPRGGGVALAGRQAPRVELDHRRGAVLDDRRAVAVDDRPARRGDGDRPHAVVERLLAVLVAGQHLQVPQAQEDDREERERDAAEDRDAQRELRRRRRACAAGAAGRLDHARLSGERPPVV